MAEYELYCFAQSGNAYKAALMLNLCGADWSPRFVDFFNGETRTPEYRAINEMGEVPVLVHGALHLSQSGVILDYLAEQLGRFGWADEAERREILRWLLWDNHKLTSYTATYRFLRAFAGKGDSEVGQFFRDRMLGAFGVLDGHLAARDFVIADQPTIADLSVCGYLWFDDEFGVDLADYPALLRWRGRLEKLDGWKHPYEMMPGHPLPAKD
jgi:glutathione S-transferase